MTRDEEKALIGDLGYEARVAFIAFCAERCLAEARRHPSAARELASLPLLPDGIDLLWTVACGGEPASEKARDVAEHVQTYEVPHPSGVGICYAHDIALVYAARVLMTGMKVLLDPEAASPERVAGAMSGPLRLIGSIYEQAMASRQQEDHLLQLALRRLHAVRDKPLTRSLLDGIPDWHRGPLLRRYVEGRLTDSLPDEEE
jgi:hypothetical protein